MGDLFPLSIRALLSKHGIFPSKALGQNFLLDKGITQRIVAAAGDLSGKDVVEVGPGPGGLTLAILEQKPRSLTVIEKDHRLYPLIEEIIEWNPKLTLLKEDALTVDYQIGEPPRVLLSNLPYNISTVLLAKWMERPHIFSCYVLMFQKEVALRLLASSGSGAYGRLSVLVQSAFQVEKVLELGPGAFTPPPKVSSMVVRLLPRPENLFGVNRALADKLLRRVFQGRRKMVRRTLASFPEALKVLESINLSPTLRPEDILLADYVRWVNVLATHKLF